MFQELGKLMFFSGVGLALAGFWLLRNFGIPWRVFEEDWFSPQNDTQLVDAFTACILVSLALSWMMWLVRN